MLLVALLTFTLGLPTSEAAGPDDWILCRIYYDNETGIHARGCVPSVPCILSPPCVHPIDRLLQLLP